MTLDLFSLARTILQEKIKQLPSTSNFDNEDYSRKWSDVVGLLSLMAAVSGKENKIDLSTLLLLLDYLNDFEPWLAQNPNATRQNPVLSHGNAYLIARRLFPERAVLNDWRNGLKDKSIDLIWNPSAEQYQVPAMKPAGPKTASANPTTASPAANCSQIPFTIVASGVFSGTYTGFWEYDRNVLSITIKSADLKYTGTEPVSILSIWPALVNRTKKTGSSYNLSGPPEERVQKNNVVKGEVLHFENIKITKDISWIPQEKWPLLFLAVSLDYKTAKQTDSNYGHFSYEDVLFFSQKKPEKKPDF